MNEKALLERKKEEQRRKLKLWDEIIPDGAFQDANIKEELTGRHIDKRESEKSGGVSSLEG